MKKSVQKVLFGDDWEDAIRQALVDDPEFVTGAGDFASKQLRLPLRPTVEEATLAINGILIEPKPSDTWIGPAEPTRTRAVRQATNLLAVADRVLPRERTHEAIGDCLERMETDDAHHLLLQLDALSTIFWAVIFSLKELGKPGVVLAAIWRFLVGWTSS